jgi:sugar-specific transcriptional regulator TrmB
LARLGWTRGRAWQVLQQLEEAGLVQPVGPGRRKVYRVSA